MDAKSKLKVEEYAQYLKKTKGPDIPISKNRSKLKNAVEKIKSSSSKNEAQIPKVDLLDLKKDGQSAENKDEKIQEDDVDNWDDSLFPPEVCCVMLDEILAESGSSLTDEEYEMESSSGTIIKMKRRVKRKKVEKISSEKSKKVLIELMPVQEKMKGGVVRLRKDFKKSDEKPLKELLTMSLDELESYSNSLAKKISCAESEIYIYSEMKRKKIEREREIDSLVPRHTTNLAFEVSKLPESNRDKDGVCAAHLSDDDFSQLEPPPYVEWTPKEFDFNDPHFANWTPSDMDMLHDWVADLEKQGTVVAPPHYDVFRHKYEEWTTPHTEEDLEFEGYGPIDSKREELEQYFPKENKISSKRVSESARKRHEESQEPEKRDKPIILKLPIEIRQEDALILSLSMKEEAKTLMNILLEKKAGLNKEIEFKRKLIEIDEKIQKKLHSVVIRGWEGRRTKISARLLTRFLKHQVKFLLFSEISVCQVAVSRVLKRLKRSKEIEEFLKRNGGPMTIVKWKWLDIRLKMARKAYAEMMEQVKGSVFVGVDIEREFNKWSRELEMAERKKEAYSARVERMERVTERHRKEHESLYEEMEKTIEEIDNLDSLVERKGGESHSEEAYQEMSLKKFKLEKEISELKRKIKVLLVKKRIRKPRQVYSARQ